MIEHLKKSDCTYVEHLSGSFVGGLNLILTGFVSIIHGLLPFCFEQYVSKVLIQYYYQHFHLHPSPDVQKIIESEKLLMERKKEILS